MRKRGICVLLLALLLSGCGQGGASAGDPGQAAPTVQAGAASPVAGMSASQVERAPRPLPEEEVLTAYERAEAMCGWFSVDLLPDSGETVEVNGKIYRKVDMAGMEDMDDLRAFLRSAFSRELTESLLEAGGECPVYQEINGALYVSGESRSRDQSKGEIDVEVEQSGEMEYSVNVTVELLEADGSAAGLECWSFPYAYEEDRWVFLEFQLVY